MIHHDHQMGRRVRHRTDAREVLVSIRFRLQRGPGFDYGEVDALYTKAVNIVIEQQKVSTSYIQRYLQIGYNRAARIVEKMEDEGLITEANNAGKRQVLRKN